MRIIALVAIMLAAISAAAPAYADTAIAANSTVKGRLERGDAQRDGNWWDTHIYAGEAGEEIRIWRTERIVTYFRIEGPKGFVQEANSYPSYAMNVRLPHRGRYKIVVGGEGDYELSVWRVQTVQPAQTLVMGQTIEAGFNTTDGFHPDVPHWRQDTPYTYVARAGETAVLRFEGLNRAYMSAEILGANDLSLGGSADVGTVGELPFYFRTAGEYRILISGDGGNYTFALEPRQAAATATPMGHISLGGSLSVALQPVSAVNDSYQTANVYTFDASQNDRLAVVVSDLIYLTVRGPDSQLVSTRVRRDEAKRMTRFELDIPATGRYRIETPVYRHSNYSLQLESLGPPPVFKRRTITQQPE